MSLDNFYIAGVAVPSSKMVPFLLEARPRGFVQLPIIGGLNQPPRLRPLRRLRGICLRGAATPPCPRRGLRLPLQLFSMPQFPANDVGHGKLTEEGCGSIKI